MTRTIIADIVALALLLVAAPAPADACEPEVLAQLEAIALDQARRLAELEAALQEAR